MSHLHPVNDTYAMYTHIQTHTHADTHTHKGTMVTLTSHTSGSSILAYTSMRALRGKDK